ncbi:hypothetical protein CDD83_1527 [Cordyceps sp. RAO-2017]|nr:hypothetical protein CDD83_1527 [Cordyceps sp. RAO-2017]
MPSPVDDEASIPALSRAPTFGPYGRSHLSPHDAALSPPLRAPAAAGPAAGDFVGHADGAADALSQMGHLDPQRPRNRGHRRKRAWKKLMWVKQSCAWQAPSLSPPHCPVPPSLWPQAISAD